MKISAKNTYLTQESEQEIARTLSAYFDAQKETCGYKRSSADFVYIGFRRAKIYFGVGTSEPEDAGQAYTDIEHFIGANQFELVERSSATAPGIKASNWPSLVGKINERLDALGIPTRIDKNRIEVITPQALESIKLELLSRILHKIVTFQETETGEIRVNMGSDPASRKHVYTGLRELLELPRDDYNYITAAKDLLLTREQFQALKDWAKDNGAQVTSVPFGSRSR